MLREDEEVMTEGQEDRQWEVRKDSSRRGGGERRPSPGAISMEPGVPAEGQEDHRCLGLLRGGWSQEQQGPGGCPARAGGRGQSSAGLLWTIVEAEEGRGLEPGLMRRRMEPS